MLGSAAGKELDVANSAEEQDLLVLKKLWLPKVLYNAIPYFYLASGIIALLATLYISEWFWVLPHYTLFSAACIHLSVMVFRRRTRSRT